MNELNSLETSETSESYQVRLEIFEGPLDLLLFLIRKKKIDIHDIPMAIITKEYLDYLNRKERIDLEREAEFLLIAALLIYIKSQMLLPREQVLDQEGDPRRPLVDRLLDFQKIKAASLLLREREDEQSLNWTRTALPPLSPEEEVIDLSDVSLFDLAEAFFTLLKRKERENFMVIPGKEVSLENKMKEILDVLQENVVLDFLEYLDKQESIEEALVSFFSLLELIKAKLVMAIQESLFQSIKVWLRKDLRKKTP
jgi:segregation and condensation protein A